RLMAAQNPASLLTSNTVCSLFPIHHPFLAAFFRATSAPESFSCACNTSCTLSVSSSTRNGLATCGSLLRFRNSRVCAPITSPVTNKKRSRSEFPSCKRPVKMLAVQARHFHVANHQVVRFAPRAFQRLAPVEQHVHAHAFVFKHVGDQPRHRGLILDYEHARAHCGPRRCAGNVLRTGKLLRVGIHRALEFVR